MNVSTQMLSVQPVQTFQFDEKPVRTYLLQETAISTLGPEPWFDAQDVCGALGISQHHRAISRLDADEKGRHTVTTPGGMQEITTVNESGLYVLILTSRKPEAQRFKRWVTHDVLPAIRRTGAYIRDPLSPPDMHAEIEDRLKTVLEGRYMLSVKDGKFEAMRPVPSSFRGFDTQSKEQCMSIVDDGVPIRFLPDVIQTAVMRLARIARYERTGNITGSLN